MPLSVLRVLTGATADPIPARGAAAAARAVDETELLESASTDPVVTPAAVGSGCLVVITSGRVKQK